MNVALSTHWKNFIKRLIESGRYPDASEVVCAGLRLLARTEGETFPPGSLRHLYTQEDNAREAKLARCLRVPKPSEVKARTLSTFLQSGKRNTYPH